MWDDTFKPCQKAIGSKNVFNLMESCQVDVCMSKEQTKAMCIAYERLVQECMRQDISIKWKAIVGCETPCDKKPCKNNGTCTADASNSKYTCKCTKNFVGVNCEKNNPCLTTPCKNGGNCTTSGMQAGKYLCTCTEKYFGTTCDKEDKCTNNPCGDNGYCSTVDGAFECACKQGYIGTFCESDSPCKSDPCKNGATCEVSNSNYKCMCKPAFYGRNCQHQREDCVCRVFGDPHYITFDDQLINFMGKCKYTLTASKASSKLPQFSVEVKNHHRGNTRVSYTRIVDLKVNGNTFRMLPGNKLMVNDEIIMFPMSNYTQVHATYSLGWVTLTTTFGVKVQFDGVHRVIVSVPSLYMAELTGICGDCNLKKDDYKTKSGDDVSSAINKFSLIGASYQVADDSDKPETNCTVVDYDSAACSPSKLGKCNVLSDRTGVFKKCLRSYSVSPKHYVASCKIDVCAYNDVASMPAKLICQVYEAFAKHCEDDTRVFTNWRKEVGCAKKCGTNEVYRLKAKVCQLNCIALPTSCVSASSEGCACKSGYKLMGNTCVVADKCGCTYKGMTVELNAEFVIPDCSETVKCGSDGKVTKYPGCKKNEDCLIQSGKRVCQCPPAFKKDRNKCLVPTFPENIMTAALAKFVRVSMAYIDGTALKTTSTNRPEVCAVICDNTTECKSFNFDEMKDECKLFSVNAVNKTLVTVNCPFQDYYQLIESKEIVIRGGTIYPCGPLTEFAVVNTLGDCKAKCKKNNCKSMEYSLVNKECSVTNSTGKDFEINGDSEFVYYGNLD